jgi:hypothetical protein
MYVNPLKRHSRGVYSKPRGTVLIKSTQIRWFQGQSEGKLNLVRGSQRLSNLS